MRPGRLERVWPWAGAAALLAFMMWPRLWSGLAVDEAGSWWIAKDGYGDLLARARIWNYTSPLYFSLLWLWMKVFGDSETAMRMLSAVCAAAAGVLAGRLGQRWGGPEAGGFAALALFSQTAVLTAAIDARPYALGLALAAGAWLLMARWAENGRTAEGVACAVCGAAAVWCHPTLALGLAPLAVFAPRLGWRRALWGVALCAALLMPLAGGMAHTMEIRQELVLAPNPSLGKLARNAVRDAAPLALVAGVAAVAAALAGDGGYRLARTRLPLAAPALLSFLPPAAIWLFGRFAGSPMFLDRYMIASHLGLALLGGWLLAGVGTKGGRLAAAAALVVSALPAIRQMPPVHMSHDWRAQAAWAEQDLKERPDTRVAVISSFIESMVPARLNDPRLQDVLRGPLLRYLGPGRGVLLPVMPDAGAEQRLQRLAQDAAPCGRLLFLGGKASVPYGEWLDARLIPQGYRREGERHFGRARAWAYARDAAGCAPPAGP
jgi:mannosyltransferase